VLYHYALKALDGAANSSSYSAVKTGQITDATAPGVPQGLAVARTPLVGQLQVTWHASTETDLAGYRLYQKPPGGTFAQVGGTLATPSYLLTGQGQGTHEFKVVAVDAAGNASADSAVATARPRVSSIVASVLTAVHWNPIANFGDADYLGLDYTWTPLANAGLETYRAPTPAGPWTQIVAASFPGPYITPEMTTCGPNYYAIARTELQQDGSRDASGFSNVLNADPTTHDVGPAWEKNLDGTTAPGVYAGQCTWVAGATGAQDQFTFTFLIDWAPSAECDLDSFVVEHRVNDIYHSDTWEPVVPSPAGSHYLQTWAVHTYTKERLYAGSGQIAGDGKETGEYRVRSRYANGNLSSLVTDSEFSEMSSCTQVQADASPVLPMEAWSADARMALAARGPGTADAIVAQQRGDIGDTTGPVEAFAMTASCADSAARSDNSSNPAAAIADASIATESSSFAAFVRPASMTAPQARIETLGGRMVESPLIVVGQASVSFDVYYYHVDHLGTPRVITDGAGGKVSEHKYFPFGEEVQPMVSANAHRFTGHERDGETGTDYMLARYFSNNQARFLSVDPGDDTDSSVPQSWNRNAYVRNNPSRHVDLTGRGTYDAVYDLQAKEASTSGETAAESVPSGVVSAAGLAAFALGPEPDPGDAVGGIIVGAWLTYTIFFPTQDSFPQAVDDQGSAKQESAGPHKTNQTPSNLPKHEKGDARKKQDRGGEKGDARRDPPRRRPPDWKGPWPPRGGCVVPPGKDPKKP